MQGFAQDNVYHQGADDLRQLEKATNEAASRVRELSDSKLQNILESNPHLVGQAVVGSLNAIETARSNQDPVAEAYARAELVRLRSAQRGRS
jgi:hypothetical protein